ncbi:MAG: O-methyltransferase [Acidimicrobiales bacterium]
MSQQLWTDVDEYVTSALHEVDPVLESALAASADAGLPSIQVSAPLGKLLHLIARVRGARRILEIGTLGGYSTIWLGRALGEGGKLISLELEPAHAEVARKNLELAGLGSVAEVRVGPALDSLAALAEQKPEPFDLVFIDADKPSNPDYFRWALELTCPGSVIVVDNVIRQGAVADPSSNDPAIAGIRKLNQLIQDDRRVSATAIQTVGAKGYDGFTLALVV